jgi:phytoene dehydrogenase-like protein
MKQPPVIVIGGGLSGLIAATLMARAKVPTLLVEKAAALGGRASTRDKHGFKFNLGPHALYRKGQLSRTLGELGVAPAAGSRPEPEASPYTAVGARRCRSA